MFQHLRITQYEYDKYQKKYSANIDKYKARLDLIDTADREYYISASYLLQLAAHCHTLFEGSEPEQKRQIIQLTLQNLRIKDGKVLYDWHKPFDSIFISADSHNWGE